MKKLLLLPLALIFGNFMYLINVSFANTATECKNILSNQDLTDEEIFSELKITEVGTGISPTIPPNSTAYNAVTVATHIFIGTILILLGISMWKRSFRLQRDKLPPYSIIKKK